MYFYLNELGVYLNGQNWDMVFNVNEIDDKVSALTGTIQFIPDNFQNVLYSSILLINPG